MRLFILFVLACAANVSLAQTPLDTAKVLVQQELEITITDENCEVPELKFNGNKTLCSLYYYRLGLPVGGKLVYPLSGNGYLSIKIDQYGSFNVEEDDKVDEATFKARKAIGQAKVKVLYQGPLVENNQKAIINN